MQFPEARPQVFPIRRWLDGRVCAYGVRVRLGPASREIVSFATGADAWAAGVDALAEMLEQAAR